MPSSTALTSSNDQHNIAALEGFADELSRRAHLATQGAESEEQDATRDGLHAIERELERAFRLADETKGGAMKRRQRAVVELGLELWIQDTATLSAFEVCLARDALRNVGWGDGDIASVSDDHESALVQGEPTADDGNALRSREHSTELPF